jgi:adenine-specific DNA-methyltransferase
MISGSRATGRVDSRFLGARVGAQDRFEEGRARVHPDRVESSAVSSEAMVRSESDLIGLALALGAAKGRLSRVERECAARATSIPDAMAQDTMEAIRRGDDPLGDALCALRSPVERRPMGATYTPKAIISAMTEWASERGKPARVVDPGSGSGRFVVAAGRAFPNAELIAVEIDPVAALLTRAHLSATGLAARARVELSDYRDLALPRIDGPTLFLGNPPYVRHHLIDQISKNWLVEKARGFDLSASQLAGLHVHFFLATAIHGRRGDYGAFITAAEWLDVNYGDLVRWLLLGPLGGEAIHLIEPTARPFADADTTAAITCFEVGAKPSAMRLRRVDSLTSLAPLEGGRPVRRERLEAARRWTPLTRATRKGPEGYVELGELCRVHRGQVTGANSVWIAGEHSEGLPPDVLFPSVTKARELFAAGSALSDAKSLRCVIDLPADLDKLSKSSRLAVDRFLRVARAMGASDGFIARHRKAWWSVGLREPAPILATYMARRPPAFVRNLADVRHINIAHGVYPREPMAPSVLDALAHHLSSSTSLSDGRTYAGGLTKFEPKEMERLLVPGPALLAATHAA